MSDLPAIQSEFPDIPNMLFNKMMKVNGEVISVFIVVRLKL